MGLSNSTHHYPPGHHRLRRRYCGFSLAIGPGFVEGFTAADDPSGYGDVQWCNPSVCPSRGFGSLPKTNTRRWQLKYFLEFSPLFGEDEPILTEYFSDGLVQPPTSNSSPLNKMGRFPRRKLVFQSSIFRGYSMLTFGGFT